MRKIAIALAAGAALLAGPALSAKDRPTGEQELAKLLEGREAGEPVNCIPLHRTTNARIIDGTAIVYDQGRTIYVNRPRHPDSLDRDDILVTRLHSSQLCRLDTVRLYDRSGFWYSGFVGLEEFVPYHRVARNN
jgi:hypothetical protein